ncbi:hypothetical protein DTO013E5_4827 [Penicillium roqueforti]|uniref:Myb-like DNA-binding domain-containing protein n=1 Tax=Penicillium roqueforti (strain FM164) TaxID=1365484 RepID=W6PRQ6_PENRF|nr:uncharacterized protein LCP9604111_6141 [Penicillium roqueforti]CDM26436.1 hypothetical protein PROQFM164_S01g000245 [Penicillium roqueforti FM164]KAF9247442.1 hypothetical protein LCP9604111_6141 [Penicillium roqueforti]KAI1834782.1 hypothetical protein CBS147337_4336 [Penicillium roqueforti]KAI2676625.1 hypothetical protein CBS147355_5727 [Penicillium roqueforti]KAI2683500.1 hypothetical protein LCP963914a_5901 [Penicillium roqueforti]
MASNRVIKAKANKNAIAKPISRPAKLASEPSREILEDRLEFVLTCIKATGMKIDMGAVSRHYGISTNAATLRLLRTKEYVAKLVRAREAAQKDDKAQKGDKKPENLED